MDIVFPLLLAFALTVAVECGVAALFRSKGLVYTVFLCNLLTNPLLNLLLLLYYNYISREYYWSVVAVLEICVVMTEALLIRAAIKCPFKKAISFSLLFNGISFAVGLLFF